MNTTFVADQVSKTFGGVRAVDAASISLPADTVTGLIGPNGAGKSTLVDLLSGQQRCDSGQIFLHGRDITAEPAFRRARLGVARTFQTSRVAGGMTLRQTLRAAALSSSHAGAWSYVMVLPRARRRYTDADQSVEVALARTGLTSCSDEYVRDLGWEQQRRLEIARALAMRGIVLLLDEPTAGMHVHSLPGFAELIRQTADAGTAVLLIEHNVGFIRRTADRLYAMDSGAVVTHGAVDSVLADERVATSYLGSATT